MRAYLIDLKLYLLALLVHPGHQILDPSVLAGRLRGWPALFVQTAPAIIVFIFKAVFPASPGLLVWVLPIIASG